MEIVEVEKIALAIFRDYQDYISARLKKSARRQFDNSELERTLEVLVKQEGFVTTASVKFADHGRYLDMQRRYQNPPAPLSVIEAWLRERNIGTNRVPGYTADTRRKSKLTEEDKIRRIARAITTSQKSQTRRRAWYAGYMYRSVQFLISQLASELAKAAMKEVINELTDGTQGKSTN